MIEKDISLRFEYDDEFVTIGSGTGEVVLNEDEARIVMEQLRGIFEEIFGSTVPPEGC